jgi:hypothetical protein
MKKVLLGFVFAIVALIGDAQIVVQGEITSNTTWTNANIYILDGFVYVRDGATLTIQPGTIIKGDFASKGSLIIERGARIIADGTPEQPIVFTSQKPAGIDPVTTQPYRNYGDWGGLIICGRAAVNTPENAGNGTAAGEALIEGGVGSIYGGGASPNNADDSGILRYVRIEFGGIPFQPNNEINGLTLGGVGSGTIIENVQISYSGDDAYEWFGGTVNAKNLIAYKNWDDDFDTDFGFQGSVQFGLVVRDPNIADQSGSNGFESDNDGTGTDNTPNTRGIFSNVTYVGPLAFSSTINSNYKRALHLRRNTETSVFNSVFIGQPVGLLIESSSTQGNATANTLRFQNNTICQMNDSLATATYANPNNINGSFDITSWFNTSGWNNGLVNTVGELYFNNVSLTSPDFTLGAGSPLATGASFTDSYISGSFFTPTDYKGAFGTEDWTACWAEWDPINEPYTSAINNEITATIEALSNTSFCQGGSVELSAISSDENATYSWSNGESTSNITVTTAGSISVMATSSNRCSAFSEIEVVVFENPEVSISANGSTSFCTGGSVELVSSQTEGNEWSNDATSASITVTSSGEYALTYTDENGCTATSNTINVSVSDSPIPTISSIGSTEICDGEAVTLTASTSDTYQWFLNGESLDVVTASVEATAEGLYTVFVSNADQCNGVGTSSPVLVTVNPTPVADGSADQDQGSFDVQFLNNSTNATSYEWNFGDGSTSTLSNPSHTYVDGGNYTVTLTAYNGDCSDVYTFELSGVSVTENTATSSVSVYPNPSNGLLNLNIMSINNGVVLTNVYDVTGKLVYNQTLSVSQGSQVISLDLEFLQNGLYFLTIDENEGSKSTVKFTVQH